MKISVLGGGSEIGASCLHVEMAGTSVVIDAGMRMAGDDALPAFGMLEQLPKPEAVFITHAHADHIGALPVLHGLYPDVPIFATPPTADLMNIMLRDAYKILEEQCKTAERLMPYTEEQMLATLADVRLFPASQRLTVGNLKVTLFRAGHILGAVMIFLEGDGESLLVTGDLSFKGGRTIPGAQVPPGIRPDVVVMESTYGNRLHTDRHLEEKRLAETVAEVVAGGGFALIPAFALGRAQEVLLILQDYMDKKQIPEFPIYVDGLVTPVSRIYRDYPQYLKGPVAHRIRVNGDAFLTNGRCHAVEPREREQVLAGKPACIVASSGMLTGGASVWYAQRLVSSEKNAIFITGYQDEESPGRKLLALADGEEDTIELNGTAYPVACRVDKYGLSAHADAGEMTRFIEAVEPTYTLLVHGDEAARDELARRLDPRFHPILVENGESYPFYTRRSGKGVVGKRYRVNPEHLRLRDWIGSLLLYREGAGEPLKPALCLNVRAKMGTLLCESPKGKTIQLSKDQVVESVGKWSRAVGELKAAVEAVFTYSRPFLKDVQWERVPGHPLSLQEIYDALGIGEEDIDKRIAVALALQALPDRCITYDMEGRRGYRLDDEAKQGLRDLTLPIQALKMDPARAMETVRTLFRDHPRFLRCGAEHVGSAEECLVVTFDFPDAVKAEERRKWADLILERTGWVVKFSDSVRQDAFQPLIESLLGRPVDAPSIHLAERRVVVHGSRPDQAETIAAAFRKTTGFELKFADEVNKAAEAGPDAIAPDIGGRPLEINQAIQEAKRWADELGIRLYKVGVKQIPGAALMELHFITPEVAARYEKDMKDLANRTGMRVTYAKHPKQNEVIRVTKAAVPDHWEIKGNPSLHTERSAVAVKAGVEPDEAERERVAAEIREKTGYDLEITH